MDVSSTDLRYRIRHGLPVRYMIPHGVCEYIEKNDMEKIVETDMEFHDILYQASRNTRLVGIIYNLREQLTRFRSTSMSYPGRLKETLEEHRRIVEAIAQGDVKEAQQAAEDHMEKAEQTLLASMEALKAKTEGQRHNKD